MPCAADELFVAQDRTPAAGVPSLFFHGEVHGYVPISHTEDPPRVTHCFSHAYSIAFYSSVSSRRAP